jgi:hypothetical protein
MLARIQHDLYRTLPTTMPWLCLGAAGLLPLAALALGGPAAAIVALLVVLAAAGSAPGRRLVRLMRVIARAARLERRATLPTRWETAR